MTHPSNEDLEFALAIECCKLDVAASSLDILAQRVDWLRFLAVCRRHRVQGLVQRSLTSHGLLPANSVGESLQQDAIAIAREGLLAATISSEILEDFRAEGLPVLFVKGLTVSKLAFGDAFAKMSKDIDILVPEKEIDRAGELLVRHGYKLAIPRHQNLGSWHRARNQSVWTRSGWPEIELHSRLATNRSWVPSIGLGSSHQDVTVTSGVVLPTLPQSHLLVYLCVHAASSAWFRLKWIAEIAALLLKEGPEGVPRLIEDGARLGAGRAVPVSLLLSQQFSFIRLREKENDDTNTTVNRMLLRLARREVLTSAEPTERWLGTVPIHLAQFFMLPSLSYKLEETRKQANEALSRMKRL